MRRSQLLVVAAAAALLAVPAGVSAQDEEMEERVDVSGTSFTLFGAPTSVEGEAIEGFLDVYNAEMGTDIGYTGTDDFEAQLRIQVDGGNPPAVAFAPQASSTLKFTDSLASLEEMGFDVEEMKANRSAGLVNLGLAEDGMHYGIPWFPNFKSIIFYHKPTFEENGYAIPETWDDLIALSERAVADGFTPWCFGFENASATGWPGTDWIEDIVLRQAGPEVYEAWWRHEIPFNDPQIVAAFETFGELIFGEGFVLGGPENISSINFQDSPGPLFNDPPGCLMLKQGSFIANFFSQSPGYEEGEEAEIGVFPFPDIDGNSGALGGGDTILVFDPTPEHIQIVKDWLTPEWMCTLASASGGGVAPFGGHGVAGVERLPGHKDVDPNCYESENALLFAELVADALGNNTFAYDAGDLMPSSVGQGTFWTGMVDFTMGKSAQEVTDTIEANWEDD